MLIHGRCHCRNIAFALAWPRDPVAIPARACTCTFCTRHGAVWTADPAATLEVSLRDPRAVSRYVFGTRTAEFLVCAACGIVTVATSLVEGRTFAVVNVNTFDGIDPAVLQRLTADFDGEEGDARLARRARHWIGDVRFVDSPGPRATT